MIDEQEQLITLKNLIAFKAELDQLFERLNTLYNEALIKKVPQNVSELTNDLGYAVLDSKELEDKIKEVAGIQ